MDTAGRGGGGEMWGTRLRVCCEVKGGWKRGKACQGSGWLECDAMLLWVEIHTCCQGEGGANAASGSGGGGCGGGGRCVVREAEEGSDEVGEDKVA
jgi:hypothetical protein